METNYILYKYVFENRYLRTLIYNLIRDENEYLYRKGKRSKSKKYEDIRDVEWILKNNHVELLKDKLSVIKSRELDIFQHLVFTENSIKMVCLKLNDIEFFKFFYQKTSTFYFKETFLKKSTPKKTEAFQYLPTNQFEFPTGSIFSKCCESGHLEKILFIYEEMKSSACKLDSVESINKAYCLQKVLDSGNKELLDWYLLNILPNQVPISITSWRLCLPRILKYHNSNKEEIFKKLGFKIDNELLYKSAIEIQDLNLIFKYLQDFVSDRNFQLSPSLITELLMDISGIKNQDNPEIHLECLKYILKYSNKARGINYNSVTEKIIQHDSIILFQYLYEAGEPIVAQLNRYFKLICEGGHMKLLEYFINVVKENDDYYIDINYPIKVVKYLHEAYSEEKKPYRTQKQFGKCLKPKEFRYLLSIRPELVTSSQYVFRKSHDYVSYLKIAKDYNKPVPNLDLRNFSNRVLLDDVKYLLESNPDLFHYLIESQTLNRLISKRNLSIVKYIYSLYEFPITFEMVISSIRSNSLETVKFISDSYHKDDRPIQRIPIELKSFPKDISAKIFNYLAEKYRYEFRFRLPYLKNAIAANNLDLFKFLHKQNYKDIFTSDLLKLSAPSLGIFKWLYENRQEGGDLKQVLALTNLSDKNHPATYKYLLSMKNFNRVFVK